MKFEVIAHRGSSHVAPENTIAAAELAWEEKADGIEVDVRMTADEKIVVIHDETTGRVSRKNIKVSKSTLAQLKAVDVGVAKNQRFTGQLVPTLEEMLQVLPPDKKILIEFKCQMSAMDRLKEVLVASGRMDDCRIICFDLQILKAARKSMPDINLYWLHDIPELDSYLTDWVIQKSLDEGFNGFMFTDSVIDEDLIEQSHLANLKVYSWTINSGNIARRFSNWGVDGIITDKPGFIKDQLKLAKAL